MKTNQEGYYDKALEILKELKKDHPTSTLGKHITLAFSEYGDMFPLSHKEFCFALEKYQAELEFNTVPDQDIEIILKDTEEMFREIESEDEFDDDDFDDEESY